MSEGGNTRQRMSNVADILLHFKIIVSVKLTSWIKRRVAMWAMVIACHILFNRQLSLTNTA